MKKKLHRQLDGLHNFVYKSVLKGKQTLVFARLILWKREESLFHYTQIPGEEDDLNPFLTVTSPLSLPSIFSKIINLHMCSA